MAMAHQVKLDIDRGRDGTPDGVRTCMSLANLCKYSLSALGFSPANLTRNERDG